MYVRWKVLIGLGTAFWLLMCLLDYLPITHIDHFAMHKQDDEKVAQEVVPMPEPPKKQDDNPNVIKVLFWNLVAFASTITVCFALKSISNKLNIINNQSLLLGLRDKSTVRKNSSSKIPIPITSKTSSTDIHIDGFSVNSEQLRQNESNKSCPNLLRQQDFEERSKYENKGDKKIWSIRIMEKHCAKLREEMIHLQTAAIKEQATVSKKMESLTKEKKELTKQFNVLSRENRVLKQQLEEMIDERTLLIKRLECATKEMKNATKNKRATIAKLDEAVANAESLKTNLEQIKRDKNVLEDKLIILDAEYRRLKGEVELQNQKEKEAVRKRLKEKTAEESSPQHVLNKPDLNEKDKDRSVLTPTKECSYSVSKSEQEMLKVQQKLLTLEKSLENFKMSNDSTESTDDTVDSRVNTLESEASKSDGAETICLYSENTSKASIDDQQSTNSIFTENECVLGHKECLKPECFLKQHKEELLKEGPSTNSICIDNNCPLEHKECLKAECFLKKKVDETDISSSSEDNKHFINYKEYMTLRKRVPKLKSSISDDRLSVISELATSTGEESGDDWCEPRRRFLTHSPAFQKFYRDTLEAHKNYISRNTFNAMSK